MVRTAVQSVQGTDEVANQAVVKVEDNLMISEKQLIKSVLSETFR